MAERSHGPSPISDKIKVDGGWWMASSKTAFPSTFHPSPSTSEFRYLSAHGAQPVGER